jgi:hypothetical protein
MGIPPRSCNMAACDRHFDLDNSRDWSLSDPAVSPSYEPDKMLFDVPSDPTQRQAISLALYCIRRTQDSRCSALQFARRGSCDIADLSIFFSPIVRTFCSPRDFMWQWFPHMNQNTISNGNPHRCGELLVQANVQTSPVGHCPKECIWSPRLAD